MDKKLKNALDWFDSYAIAHIMNFVKSKGFRTDKIPTDISASSPSLLIQGTKTRDAAYAFDLAVIVNWDSGLIKVLYDTAKSEEEFSRHLEQFFFELTQWDASGCIDWPTQSQKNRTPISEFVVR